MSVTLYIVRHGETEWNKENKMQGRLNSNLTNNGISQAMNLAEIIKNEKIDVIYTSPSSRAIQTTNYLNKFLNKQVNLCPSLDELSMGNWEGVTYTEIQKKFPNEWYNFWNDPVSYKALNGGETFENLIERITLGIEDIICENQNQNILLVSHRITIRFLLSYLLEKHVVDIPDLDSTSLSKISINNKKNFPVFLNNIDHYS